MLSLAVCSYNRCESLRETLQSLAKLRWDAREALEIVVVDNNSADRTRDVVEAFRRTMAWPVHYVKEPRQGIASARNRALDTARGTYVAFIDDDALADPEWATAIWRCAEDTQADLIGGTVRPLWLTERPRWLSDDLLGPIMALDYGPHRKRCANGETFLTTNCTLRRASLERHGAFETSLGRRGQRWIGGEDVELCRRWLRRGAHVVYEPAAIVQHKVEATRVTPAFYRRWFEDIGYTQAHQLDWKWHHRLSVLPAWRWKQLARAGANYARARVAPSSDEARFQAELWWLFQRSFMRERLDHWRSKVPCRFANVR
mgnify:CR=1 FL=1